MIYLSQMKRIGKKTLIVPFSSNVRSETYSIHEYVLIILDRLLAEDPLFNKGRGLCPCSLFLSNAVILLEF